MGLSKSKYKGTKNMGKHSTPNIRHLQKILSILNEIPFATKTDLFREYGCCGSNYINNALLFLEREGLIHKARLSKKESKSTKWKYSRDVWLYFVDPNYAENLVNSLK